MVSAVGAGVMGAGGGAFKRASRLSRSRLLKSNWEKSGRSVETVV